MTSDKDLTRQADKACLTPTNRTKSGQRQSLVRVGIGRESQRWRRFLTLSEKNTSPLSPTTFMTSDPLNANLSDKLIRSAS